MQSEPQSIDFDWANFTHAPALFQACVILSVIGLGLVALSAFLRLRQLRLWFYLGGAITAGWYLFFTFGILRFGILWPTTSGTEVLFAGVSRSVVSSRAADCVYLVAWYAVSAITAIGVQTIGKKFSKRSFQH